MGKSIKVPAIWLLLILVGFPQLSETIYSPALPSIAHSLMTSNALVQWTLSIYFMGFALGVLFWGWISDHIGRRRGMLLGLLVYVIAGILCFKAGSIHQLLVFRFIQGLGASCGSVLTQAIVRESLPEQKRHQIFSMTGFVLALCITLGPFLGGYLTQWFDWRANFVFLALMGFSILLLSLFKLSETQVKSSNHPPISFLSIAKKMLHDKHIWISAWVVGAVNGMLFSYYAEGPFVFIRIIHLTPSQFGQLGVFIAIAALVGSLVCRKLVKTTEASKIIRLGVSVLMLSSVAFVLLVCFIPLSSASPVLSSALIILPMMGLMFAAFGLIIPITLSQALLSYKESLGRAGALFGLGYYVFVSLFTWAMGAIHNGQAWTMAVYFLCLSASVALVSRWGQAFRDEALNTKESS